MLEKILTWLTICDNILSIKGGCIMFADRLKQLRIKKGLTQVEFAKKFNISSGTIAMWETGKRTPDVETLKKIANFFDVTLDYLLFDNLETDNSKIDNVYLSLAKEAQNEGIDPRDIKLAIETIKAMRNK